MQPVSLAVDGAVLQGVRWKGTAGRTPVLLVHGLGGSSVEWTAVGGALAATFGDVLAVDLPGFGRSPLPRGAAGIPSYRAVVAGLLADLGPTLLVGTSLGGLVSLGVAASDATHVRGLVLVDPALASAAGGTAALRGALRFALPILPGLGASVLGRRQRRLGAERHVAERLAVIVHDPERVPADVRADLVELAAWRIPRRDSHRAYSAAARSLVPGVRSGWRALGAVRAPTLFVHGRHDQLVPVDVVERVRAVRPDWHYEVLDGTGHVPYLEAPDRFVATVTGWAEGAELV